VRRRVPAERAARRGRSAAAGADRRNGARQEQLAGFYLIEARDLNEAIQIAGKIPPAREGSIEVRPVRQLEP
jgi:hypothetical protein